MAWEPNLFKDLHQLPREEHVFPGTPLCAGCGGLESLRLASKVLGSRDVYVNAAGCFTKATEGAKKIYGEITPIIQARLDHELEVIARMGFEPIF